MSSHESTLAQTVHTSLLSVSVRMIYIHKTSPNFLSGHHSQRGRGRRKAHTPLKSPPGGLVVMAICGVTLPFPRSIYIPSFPYLLFLPSLSSVLFPSLLSNPCSPITSFPLLPSLPPIPSLPLTQSGHLSDVPFPYSSPLPTFSFPIPSFRSRTSPLNPARYFGLVKAAYI